MIVSAALLLAAAALAGPAAAGSWEGFVSRDGDSAGASVSDGARSMRIDCNRGDDALFLQFGGVVAPSLPTTGEPESTFMLWVAMADGRTARFPVDVYLVDYEAIWLGRWPVTSGDLDWFARAATIEVTVSATGEPLMAFALDGSAAARAAMRRGCGF